LRDRDISDICSCLTYDPVNPLAQNKILKVLDISSNPITSLSALSIAKMMEMNRTLEYLGMAKCDLKSDDIKPILQSIGRIPFPEAEAEQHLAKCKARDQVVEKNKKAKAAKKPEEPVPLLDNIEQAAIQDKDGNEITSWVLLRNVQYKHLNFCMN